MLIAGAFASAFAAAAIVATGGVVSEPSLFAAVLVANIVTLGLGGLVWRRGRPASLFGNLLLAEGVLVFVSSLSGASSPALYLIGMLGVWATALGATWLLLVFPGSRLGGRGPGRDGDRRRHPPGRRAPAAARVPQGGRAHRRPQLRRRVPGQRGARQSMRRVPPRPSATSRVLLQLAWGVALLVYLATRFLWASHARRRLLLPVFISAAPFVVAFALNAALFDLAGVQPTDTARAIFAGTRILVPLGFVAGLLFARAYARRGARVHGPQARGTRLRSRPSSSSCGACSTIRRPGCSSGCRGASSSSTGTGLPFALDPAFERITWRVFGHGEAKVLAIVHDDVLSDDPELVEAVGAASLLTLENRRLEHDLLDSVDALRASQRRLVGAASAERRKIERDLHDGVQQKLVALRIELELARDLADDGALDGRLAELASELRRRARRPPLDRARHLSAAPRRRRPRRGAPRGRAPLASSRSALDLEDVGRLSEDRETAIYYCCLEALQNVAKHAGDGAAATLRLWRDRNIGPLLRQRRRRRLRSAQPGGAGSRAHEHDRPDRGGGRDARRAVGAG